MSNKTKLRNYYEPLSVVAYITKEAPKAKWSCHCTSGPEYKWKRKGNELIQCDACNVYSHIRCYKLNHLTELDLDEYFHICDNCKNNQFQTKILHHGFLEWILNKSNHPKKLTYKIFKDALFNKWINYSDKYFSSMTIYGTIKNKANTIQKYHGWCKDRTLNTRYKRGVIKFKKEINDTISNISKHGITLLFDINDLNTNNFDTLGEWFMELQTLKCFDLMNEYWLKLKYKSSVEVVDDEESGNDDDKDGIDLLLRAATLIEQEEQGMNINNKKRKLVNGQNRPTKRRRLRK